MCTNPVSVLGDFLSSGGAPLVASLDPSSTPSLSDRRGSDDTRLPRLSNECAPVVLAGVSQHTYDGWTQIRSLEHIVEARYLLKLK